MPYASQPHFPSECMYYAIFMSIYHCVGCSTRIFVHQDFQAFPMEWNVNMSGITSGSNTKVPLSLGTPNMAVARHIRYCRWQHYGGQNVRGNCLCLENIVNLARRSPYCGGRMDRFHCVLEGSEARSSRKCRNKEFTINSKVSDNWRGRATGQR